MASISLKQCQSSISSDLSDMQSWMSETQEAANREGHLDVKFLHARYARGVAQVEKYMEEKHMYIECDGLASVQPDILRYMHKHSSGHGIFGSETGDTAL